jgi:uncharacterized RmlC-like cupin family protein
MLLADQTTSRSAIHIIRPDQLNAETLQTPGSQRLSAISAAQGIASAVCAGTFLVEPTGQTGIHHHGEQDTVVFVLDGEAIVVRGTPEPIVVNFPDDFWGQ